MFILITHSEQWVAPPVPLEQLPAGLIGDEI